jgi:serine/threonine protein kinase
MGRVYLGEHVKMNRQCAIKVMSPALVNDAESASRFAREASNSARIIHPNVAAVFDYGESDGLVYLVMEFVDGEPLSRLLAREAPFALERAIDLARQIADGLGAAHELGIVHRDLKPDNILVSRSRSGREVVKVVDFGIAKAMQEGAGEALTRTGLVIGTPEFMSPEQLLGDPIDARSDLYALGCIMHLMLTAAPAFDAPTREQMIKRRLSENPPHAQALDPGIPDAIDRVIMRLLARTPDDRYSSAAEVREALSGPHTRRLSGDGTVIPRVETPRSAPTVTFSAATPARTTPKSSAAVSSWAAASGRRRRWPWVLGVLGIIAIASSTVVRQAREAREARYASAQRDSARRADSLRRLLQAQAESASSQQLIGGMVDTARLRADSIANATKTLQNAVISTVRRYADALQSGDKAAARTVFPNATDRDLSSWDTARGQYDLRFSVASPSRVRFSDHNLIADLDFMLQVQYIDRATRSVYNTNRLPRHATLTKQGQRWQIDKLSGH